MSKKDIKSLEERAKNYANEVQQITDFVEQVRQTPDVYIGKIAGNRAFLTMAREIIQNAIDEILKGVAFSNIFYVRYDERNHCITVEDNGRGIPHGKIGIIFGTGHTSSNYHKELYEYSAGKNGCGASVTNALSSKFTVDSFVVGKGKHAEFIEGHLWNKGEIDIDGEGKQGSIISFIPNENEIGQVTATWKDVYDLLFRIIPSTPIGTTVEYTGIDINGDQHIATIVNQDGVLTYLVNMTQNPYIAPIGVKADNGEMKVDLVFTYDTSANTEEQIISLNNTCPTDGGSHVEGALDGICKWFKNYMNKIYLSNVKSKTKLIATNNDIRTGLKLAVSTFCIKALYNGQAKDILDNEKMIPFVSTNVQAGLNEWSKTNPVDLQKLCKWFKEVIELRMKSDKERIKLSSNFVASSLSGLPAKYIKPNSRHNTELIIVEGDSAFSSARNSRDHATQGVFPIRGKIPNVFTKSEADILKNEEISGILTIIGAGYGKKFDLNKCKVERVIIMADADPDGAHIRTLVLRFLAMYCRPLVEAGRVYAAMPPLYGIELKKNKWRYFTDKLDFVKYIQSQFLQQNTITDSKGKNISNKDILSLLYRNSDYVATMDRVANTYAIDSLLLELLLKLRKKDFKTFSSEIKKKYRFMDVVMDKQHNTIIIKGLANDKYHEIFFNDYLINQCIDVIPYIENNASMYKLNGYDMTLYQLMTEFNRFIPAKLSRFKGLGEMDESMLGNSTLNYDNRTLIRYNFEDITKDIEQMRFINNNKDVLLKDLNILE